MHLFGFVFDFLSCDSYLEAEKFEEAVRDYDKVFQMDRTKGAGLIAPSVSVACTSMCLCVDALVCLKCPSFHVTLV